MPTIFPVHKLREEGGGDNYPIMGGGSPTLETPLWEPSLEEAHCAVGANLRDTRWVPSFRNPLWVPLLTHTLHTVRSNRGLRSARAAWATNWYLKDSLSMIPLVQKGIKPLIKKGISATRRIFYFSFRFMPCGFKNPKLGDLNSFRSETLGLVVFCLAF